MLTEQMLTPEQFADLTHELIYRAVFGRGLDETLKALGLPLDAEILLNVNDYAFGALKQVYDEGKVLMCSVELVDSYAKQAALMGRIEALAKRVAKHWRLKAKQAGVKWLSLDPRSDWFAAD